MLQAVELFMGLIMIYKVIGSELWGNFCLAYSVMLSKLQKPCCTSATVLFSVMLLIIIIVLIIRPSL